MFGNKKWTLLVGITASILVGCGDGENAQTIGINSQGEIANIVADSFERGGSENFTSGLTTADPSPSTTGELNLAILLVQFKNDRSKPWSKDQVQNEAFSGPNSVSSFYEENSYEKLKIRGEVFGWYTLPFDKPTSCNDMGSLLTKIDESLTQIDMTRYSNVAIAFPRICEAWDGFGSVGKVLLKSSRHPKEVPLSVSWINGSPNFGSVLIHEIGHNLGLRHANGCASIQTDGSCDSIAYADPFDAMGFVHPNEKPRQFNARHKDQLGWLDSTRIMTVTSSGIYSIRPLENRTSSLQALRIPRSVGGNYYLEFRSPSGFDSELGASPASNGLSIRLASNIINGGDTHLIDTVSEMSEVRDFKNAPLLRDQTFYDPAAKIEMRTIRVLSTEISVQIDLNPLTPIPAVGGDVTDPNR